MKWGYNWELGPFETWDALGFAETTDRMEKDGVALPASIKKMRERAPRASTATTARCSISPRATYVGAPDRSAQRHASQILQAAASAGAQERRRRGVGPRRRRARPDLQDQGEQHRCRRHRHARTTRSSKRRARLPRAGDLPTRASTSASAPTCSWWSWRPGRRTGTPSARWSRRYQDATQRLKYARVPVVAAPYGMTLGGGLELCFACRRRAGRGRDLLGPRRGRRRASSPAAPAR